MRLLLADDNADNRDMLSRRLRRRGHEVILAEDGSQAVAAARSGSFDLVLMDVSMPVMCGLEATRVLRSEAGTAALPIIALTAHASPTDRRAALDAGCDDFATKPIDFAALSTMIAAREG